MPPLYDFECRICGKGEEHLERMLETRERVHEGCGGTMRRLVTRQWTAVGDTPEFVTDDLGDGTPERIRGKQHLERVMRERGVHVTSKKGQEWW